MAGNLIAVVGPSGVGKDTIMVEAARRRDDIFLVRRVITRPEAAGGEDFEGVTAEEFAKRHDAGRFALSWQAHGLDYGIPVEIDARLAEGQTLLFNGSRRMLDQARARYPGLIVALITASRDTLAQRLRARGRETPADIESRLQRAAAYAPEGADVRKIDNDGRLEDAVDALLRLLHPERA